MSVLSGPPPGGGMPPPGGAPAYADPNVDGPAESPVATDVPVRAGGLELIGEMPGSGYRRPPALVRRRDGQTLQLTRLLYLVLEAVDGERNYDDIATHVGAASGRSVSGADVRTLIDGQLRPLGLVCRPDGSEPEVRKA